MLNTFYLAANDEHEIFVREWSVDEPKAIVQIVHGMNEHSGCYHEFACFLNDEGYSVFVTDHWGHGNSVLHVDEIGHM